MLGLLLSNRQIAAKSIYSAGVALERSRLTLRSLDLVVASELRGRLLLVLMLLDRPRLALLQGSVSAGLLLVVLGVGVLASNLVKSSVSV